MDFNFIKIDFNFNLKPKHGLSVTIPDVFTFSFGRKIFSLETFDKGLPIRIETGNPITVSNILFCTVEGKKPDFILHNFALSEILKIKGLETLFVPWKEVNEASLMCLVYDERKPNTSYYLAIYDQFTKTAQAANEPFVPFVLNYFSVAFVPEFDRMYKERVGFSLKALMSAKTMEERQRVVGIQIGKRIQIYKPENSKKSEKKKEDSK